MANSHVCDRCDKNFIGDSYYDSMGTYDIMCEDCARQYYSPFPYENFKND